MIFFVTISPINKQRKMASRSICLCCGVLDNCTTCGVVHLNFDDQEHRCEDTLVFKDEAAKDVLYCVIQAAPTFEPLVLYCCGQVVDKHMFNLHVAYKIQHEYLRCPHCQRELNASLVRESLILNRLVDALQVNLFIYINMYICFYVYMFLCFYVYMYICIYVYMFICLYVYMFICLYVYIYKYVYRFLFI